MTKHWTNSICAIQTKRNWTPGIIVRTGLENSRTYSVKAIQGGVYVQNRKFFRTRYVDAPHQIKQTNQTTPTLQKKPKQTIRKLQRLIETVGQIRETQYQNAVQLNMQRYLNLNNSLSTSFLVIVM